MVWGRLWAWGGDSSAELAELPDDGAVAQGVVFDHRVRSDPAAAADDAVFQARAFPDHGLFQHYAAVQDRAAGNHAAGAYGNGAIEADSFLHPGPFPDGDAPLPVVLHARVQLDSRAHQEAPQLFLEAPGLEGIVVAENVQVRSQIGVDGPDVDPVFRGDEAVEIGAVFQQ